MKLRVVWAFSSCVRNGASVENAFVISATFVAFVIHAFRAARRAPTGHASGCNASPNFTRRWSHVPRPPGSRGRGSEGRRRGRVPTGMVLCRRVGFNPRRSEGERRIAAPRKSGRASGSDDSRPAFRRRSRLAKAKFVELAGPARAATGSWTSSRSGWPPRALTARASSL